VKKNTGIILKQYHPQNRKICVLDKQLGKITCIPNKKRVATGALISYFITRNKAPFFIDSIEILAIPFDTAINDILFLHHILELCDYFIPLQSPSKEVFILINYLYFFPNKIKSILEKKFFLFKLFIFLGVYPAGTEFQNPYFHSLASQSIDTIISNNLHSEIEKDLDRWLHACIDIHPDINKLKTVSFLCKSRLL